METKDLIGLALILLAIPASVLVCCVWQRGRDAAFFLMAAGVVLTEKLDINFVTRYWYRGTTRGFEFTFIDILALGVLVSSFLLPRPGQSRWFWPASLGALLLYLFYGCFSVAISEPKLFGFFEISKILRGIMMLLAATWFVRSERELAIVHIPRRDGLPGRPDALLRFQRRRLSLRNQFAREWPAPCPVLAAQQPAHQRSGPVSLRAIRV